MGKHTPTTMRKCPECNAIALAEAVITHTAEILHDGTLHEVSAEVPALVCSECGSKFFDFRADRALRRALRDRLGLLQPEEMKAIRERLSLTQEDVAKATGIAATTISKWEQAHVIQSCASDDHLRRFFDDILKPAPAVPVTGVSAFPRSSMPSTARLASKHWKAMIELIPPISVTGIAAWTDTAPAIWAGQLEHIQPISEPPASLWPDPQPPVVCTALVPTAANPQFALAA
jgi:putative zinc finger/helix-turn-helix YgiT family protein